MIYIVEQIYEKVINANNIAARYNKKKEYNKLYKTKGNIQQELKKQKKQLKINIANAKKIADQVIEQIQIIKKCKKDIKYIEERKTSRPEEIKRHKLSSKIAQEQIKTI